MRRVILSVAWAVCLSAGAAASAQPADGADLRFLSTGEDGAWVGEKVEVYLELWTEALSFSDQQFTLPEVRGGYLLQPGTTTLKMTERRGRATWQGIRYTFNLYPQRAGEIVIPPFEVRFSTGAGYGSEPQPHAFETPELTVEARLPPGADAGNLLVTTTDFALAVVWEPAREGEAEVELLTGDALVLTVRREAGGVPGMVFAPLPAFDLDGIGVYPDAPVVDDRANRGELTGTRVDRVTLVCEKPGRYRLPELRFQWWDPVRERLNEEIIPERVLDVSANPAWGAQASAGDDSGGIRPDWRYLWLLPLAILIWWPGRALAAWLGTQLRARRLAPLNPRT